MSDIKTLKKKGFKYVCGVDEAGRGPLAGPLSLSFFVVSIEKYDQVLGPLLEKGLDDSKKLSEAKREELFTFLQGSDLCITKVGPLQVHNSMVSASIIDRYGIAKCMNLLIKRLLKRISTSNVELKKTYFLLDGAIKFPKEISHEVIVGGDGIEPVIMASSVVSKVKRDRRMKLLAKKFPEYGFEIHKGYGTQKHRDLIKRHGTCPEHRISFCKNILNI